MTYRWQLVTDMSASNHRCLEPSDICVYYRVKEKHVYGSFTETNSIVTNFKKKPSICRSNQRMTEYKEDGVRTITKDVLSLFSRKRSGRFLLVPAITSKACDDVEYDNRLVRVCRAVSDKLDNVDCLDLLSVNESIASAHAGGSRSIDFIRSKIVVSPGYDLGGYDYVFIFDDVLTTGAHFKACQLELEREYGIRACGLFWAREETLEQL